MSQAVELEKQEQTFAELLKAAVRSPGAGLDAHLVVLKTPVQLLKTKAVLHLYGLPVDAHGNIRFKPLAEHLRNRIIDYAIPRNSIEEAVDDFQKTGSTIAFSKLESRARALFTDLANSGEGGELLLFAMAESVFQLAQVICKTALKTSSAMHFHGSDGVYAEARADGGLNLYWGESKMYSDATDAVRECFSSLAPFLVQPDGQEAIRERDIFLINEFANFTDARLINGLKSFLDRDNVQSLSVRHCGIALVVFDCDLYPNQEPGLTSKTVVSELLKGEQSWTRPVLKRLGEEKLNLFDIHCICIPMPSASDFRDYFLELLRR